jgi:hypothetical protein
MIEISKLIHYVVFIDADNRSFYFHGRFTTNDRNLCVSVLEFCNQNNILCKYTYRNKKTDKFAIKISPQSVEEAWILFHQPFKNFIFAPDLTH